MAKINVDEVDEKSKIQAEKYNIDLGEVDRGVRDEWTEIVDVANMPDPITADKFLETITEDMQKVADEKTGGDLSLLKVEFNVVGYDWDEATIDVVSDRDETDKEAAWRVISEHKTVITLAQWQTIQDNKVGR